MKLYEIDRGDIRECGGVKKAIAKGAYIIRDNAFVQGAFNLGHGTKKDMNEYMKNNRVFCVWIDAETMQQVTRI